MSDYIVVHGIRICKNYESFVPETFGRLTTIGPRFLLPVGSKFFVAKQVCICSCGSVSLVARGDLKSGTTKSCGCLGKEMAKETCIRMRTTHGMSHTSTYKIWKDIKKRCLNPKHSSYHNYGGRGITVCDRWLEPDGQGFLNFLADMGERPSPRHEVERKHVNGNYCPENCEWILLELQARNKRNNHNLTYNGKTQCLAAWAEEVGINQETIRDRLKRGWSVEKSLTSPAQANRYY